ncbi:hypothetical protein F5Y10DRAFT_293723 [Nemania abortiva]|nr:hypothetical protein F5Y10DRAFT_293723 [Nemania abortiva]
MSGVLHGTMSNNSIPEALHSASDVNTTRNVRNPFKIPEGLEAPFKRDEKKREIRNRQIQERWRKGIENRLELPENRFPIIIRAGTGVSSPENLKDILGLESVPKTFTTKTTSLGSSDADTQTPITKTISLEMTDAYPGTSITGTADLEVPEKDPMTAPREEVVYCEVSWKQITAMREKGWAWEQIVIWYNGQKRFARVILPRATTS